MSLFACRCKYFSKCKSIKVAMSSSRACYSQLRPWPKMEHTPWNGEHVKKKSLDVLHLGHLLRRPARASNPSWRPNWSWLRVCFGVQEQSALKWVPRSHMGSDLSSLGMDGKIISRFFQWHQSQAQIHLESTGILKTKWHPESVLVLHHRFSVFGPCIELSPLGVRPGEVLHDLNPLLAATSTIIRLWFLLRFTLSRIVVAVHRFVKPQLVRLIIHLQSHFNWAAFFRVLTCVLRCACRD